MHCRARNFDETQGGQRPGLEQHGLERRLRPAVGAQGQCRQQRPQVHHSEVVSTEVQRNLASFTSLVFQHQVYMLQL